jgi:two-component system, response regulator
LPCNKFRSILVVEDNDDDQLVLANALQMARVDSPLVFVKDVQSAKEYLWQASNDVDTTPCLVLLDLSLPLQGGLEFLQAIRSEPKTRRIPVIVLTGSREQQDLIDSYSYGANSYIAKTGNLAKFYDKISCMCMYWLDICQLPSS